MILILTNPPTSCTVFLYNKRSKLETEMTIQTTYTRARAGLARLLDQVTKDREVVIIQRRKGEDVAMISADELSSLMESAHLLRSPKNAGRLIEALGRALKNEGTPMDIEELRQEVNLDKKNT